MAEKNKFTKENMPKAVAIEYEEKYPAPKVIAKGQGYIAEKIIEKGKQHDIQMLENKELVENLMAITLGEEIPEELYEIVAKILLYVETIDKK